MEVVYAQESVGVKEAARILGLSESTVRRAVQHGHLIPWRTPGGHRRFTVASLEAFKNSAA